MTSHIPRWTPALAVVVGVLVGLFLIGCSDATGPSEPTYRPQFQKVYGAGDAGGGGGGGGASGGFAIPGCSTPTASAECFRKFLLLIGGAGSLTACGGATVASAGAIAFACGMGALGWGEQARGWLETPDCRSCLEPGLPMPGQPGYPTIGPDPHSWSWEN